MITLYQINLHYPIYINKNIKTPNPGHFSDPNTSNSHYKLWHDLIYDDINLVSEHIHCANTEITLFKNSLSDFLLTPNIFKKQYTDLLAEDFIPFKFKWAHPVHFKIRFFAYWTDFFTTMRYLDQARYNFNHKITEETMKLFIDKNVMREKFNHELVSRDYKTSLKEWHHYYIIDELSK